MKRNLDAYTTYAIAVLAFALSYSKLVDLASRAGYSEIMAHAWPIIVDGLAVMAARGVMRLAKARWYAWSLLVAGTAVSLVAAVANAMIPPGPLPPVAAAAVAVVPPLCVPFASHLARKMRPVTEATAEPDSPPASVEQSGAHAEQRDEPTQRLRGALRRDDAADGAHHADAAECVAPAAGDAECGASPTPTSDDASPVAALDIASKRQSHEEKRVHVMRLVATGEYSNRRIADIVGTSEGSVRRWRKEATHGDAPESSRASGLIRA